MNSPTSSPEAHPMTTEVVEIIARALGIDGNALRQETVRQFLAALHAAGFRVVPAEK